MRDLTYLDYARLKGAARGNARNGAFEIRVKPTVVRLLVIASDGAGWDHVSVSVKGRGAPTQRCPTWAEMAYVKDLFFAEDEVVMQLHPTRAHYVNNGEVLHLWRPQLHSIPVPPAYLVGIPGLTAREIAGMTPQERAAYREAATLRE